MMKNAFISLFVEFNFDFFFDLAILLYEEFKNFYLQMLTNIKVRFNPTETSIYFMIR